MPQINVTIDGKNYRMACGEGEEDHLTELAATLDSRIGDMRRAFADNLPGRCRARCGAHLRCLPVVRHTVAGVPSTRTAIST